MGETRLTARAPLEAACLRSFPRCRRAGQRHVAGVSALRPFKDHVSQPPYIGLCDGHAEHHIAADAASPAGVPLLPL